VTSPSAAGQKKAAVQKPPSESDESDSNESDGRHKAKPAVTVDRRSTGKVIIISCFLADSRSHSLFAVARPSVVCLSVVCNMRAPYSGSSNFRQYFYGIRYLGHLLTSVENFTEIVPGEPLRWGS